jgi:hypothetical protein
LKGLKGIPNLPGLPGPESKPSPGPVDPHTLAVIRDALTRRRPITARYDGKHRELSPIALGTKDGELNLWAYQFGGESTHKCKCFSVAKFESVDPMLGNWQAAGIDAGPGACIDALDQYVNDYELQN